MTLHIGECSIDKVIEQTSSLPFAALFPAHRETMGDTLAQQPAEISIHSWVVRTARDTIVIDTATGNGRNRDNKPLFHQLQTAWPQRLAEAGVDPDEVTLVLMTHIHTDHVGWNTVLKKGQWRPTFPNARYYFSADEYHFYQNPLNVMPESTGAMDDSVYPVVASGQAVFLDSAETEVVAGLQIHRTPGHSVDHLAFSFSDGGETALFWGDVVHSPLQICLPEWNSRYCEFPDTAKKSRTVMMNFAAQTRALVFTSHFPDSSAGRVLNTNGQLTWQHA